MMRNLIATALLAIPLASTSIAADTTGTVRGIAVDSSGAVVPGVKVQLISDATGQSLAQQTDMAGQYSFNAVPPGTYRLTGSLEGFQTYSVTGVLVELNKSSRVNLTLTVGEVTQVVDVSASAVQIETSSAQVSTNVERRYVTELPNSSRNALAMAVMAPGVTLTMNRGQVLDSRGSQIKVNGLRKTQSVFYLDGSDNTAPFRNTAMQFPNPEAVSEVQVTTANTSAEFGKQPGGVVNVVTRSGTNELHGSGSFFFRNENLNANDWNRNRLGLGRQIDNIRQIGGAVGGPIRRNKTFFFSSYLAYRDSSPGFQNTCRAPTEAMLQGDFSAFARQLYHPDTGAPLAGNRIPASLLDPVAVRMRKLIPTVSNFDDRLVWEFDQSTKNNEWLNKVDHSFNDHHRLSVSYLPTWGVNVDDGGNQNPVFGVRRRPNRQDTIAAKHNWMVSTSMIVEGRFTYAGLRGFGEPGPGAGNSLESFGAKWPVSFPGAEPNIEYLDIADGFNSRSGVRSIFDQRNARAGGVLSWIKGSHNIKFGYESQRTAVRQTVFTERARFTFDGRSSSTPAGGRPTGINTFGFAMADFVMGRIGTFNTQGLRDYDVISWSHYFFVQDEWKLTSRLTLTPGLRYEFYSPPFERNARSSAFVLGHQSSLYPDAPLHMAFEGDSGVPKGFYRQDRNNFAPRLGIAWDPQGNGKTAIRGGFGVYYSFLYMNLPMWNAERTPWNASADGGEARLADPWGTSRTVVYNRPLTPFSLTPENFNYPPRINQLLGYDSAFATPYTLQWNFSIEREIRRGVTLQVGYVGNRGLKLFQILDGNLPVFTPTASLRNVIDRRPLSRYGFVEMGNTRARSWFDSLQVVANFRPASSLTSRFTYVYGRAFAQEDEDRGEGSTYPANPLSLAGEKAEMGPRHVARWFYVYDLPFFRKTSGWYRHVLGGWQTSGLLSIQSGTRLDIRIGEDYNFDGINLDRPDALAPVRVTGGSRDERMLRYFNTEAVARPADRSRFGTLGRRALPGPMSWSLDTSLLKNFYTTESDYVQIRAEAFNVTNTPMLNNPVLNLNSQDFARVLTLSGNRTMQIGIRYVF